MGLARAKPPSSPSGGARSRSVHSRMPFARCCVYQSHDLLPVDVVVALSGVSSHPQDSRSAKDAQSDRHLRLGRLCPAFSGSGPALVCWSPLTAGATFCGTREITRMKAMLNQTRRQHPTLDRGCKKHGGLMAVWSRYVPSVASDMAQPRQTRDVALCVCFLRRVVARFDETSRGNDLTVMCSITQLLSAEFRGICYHLQANLQQSCMWANHTRPSDIEFARV